VRWKVCKQCEREQPIRNFYRHSHYADGREGICKRCKIANVEANRELKFEHYQAKKRAWAARPENVEKRRAYRRSERGRQVHRAIVHAVRAVSATN
jgi:superfamily II helicase